MYFLPRRSKLQIGRNLRHLFRTNSIPWGMKGNINSSSIILDKDMDKEFKNIQLILEGSFVGEVLYF
jgi:hypothetical protein